MLVCVLVKLVSISLGMCKALKLYTMYSHPSRSIQPTFLALLDPQAAETLRQNREKLSSNITELINEYGPKVFTDFDGKPFLFWIGRQRTHPFFWE